MNLFAMDGNLFLSEDAQFNFVSSNFQYRNFDVFVDDD